MRDGGKEFHGQVKYSGIATGSVSWKSGGMVLIPDDNGWRLEMFYNVSKSPVLTLSLSPSSIKKFACTSTFFMECKNMSQWTTVYFKSPDKRVMSNLKSLIEEINSSAPEVAVSKSEIGIKASSQTPDSAQRFTSVKENKKRDKSLAEERKENIMTNQNSSSNGLFLQKSEEKSRQCLGSLEVPFYSKSTSTYRPLCNSTPTRPWQSSKRQPGLMPDPTPTKRARLSDFISYSMKPKTTQPVDQKQSQSLQGFSNLGNTCYMNAILQALFGLDTFSADLTANRRMLKALSSQSLYYALVRLLQVKRQPLAATDITKRESLRRVKNAISSSARRFSGYGQHDAHEFLGQVLDQLKEEVVKVTKTTPSPNREGEGETPPINPITVNFEFEVLHTLTCLQCGEHVSKTEQFHDISLDVPKRKDLLTPRTLQDALGMFFRSEKIEYTCEKCGHNQSSVSHKIARLPRVFILHLKRYSYCQEFSKNTKMGQNVSIPTYLTLQHHCEENTQPAYPPLHQPATYSEQKSLSSVLDDSREETPSRRRLDYPGFKFLKKGPSLQDASSQVDSFTETKEKRDEVDGNLPKPITLEDEDDSDITRAIEMSLWEQEERDRMKQDCGEESDLERALELSIHSKKQGLLSKKDLNEMSEEERIQLAIEQSLMDTDPYHYSNYTQNDDVINSVDHDYTGKSDLIGGNHQHSLENGEFSNGDHAVVENGEDIKLSSDNDKSLTYDSSPEDLDSGVANDNVVPQKCGVSLTENSETPHHDLSISSVECPCDSSDLIISVSSSESEPAVDGKVEETDSVKKRSRVSWTKRLTEVSSHFSSGDDDDMFVCRGRKCSEASDGGEVKNNGESLNRVGPTEVLIESDTSQSVVDLTISECVSGEDTVLRTSKKTDENQNKLKKNVLEGSEDFVMTADGVSVKEESGYETEKCVSGDGAHVRELYEGVEQVFDSDRKPVGSRVPVSEKVGHTEASNKGDNCVKSSPSVTLGGSEMGLKEDEPDFDCQEDDSWMLEADDKENTSPGTERPRLSDPAQFSLDTEVVDEVDGSVDEALDLPEIHNETGDLPYSYRLVSVVNHMGLSSSTGHYLSDVYDMRKRGWYSYDDSHVTRISETDMRTKRERSGYIFFYMSKEIYDDLCIQSAMSVTEKKSTSTS